MRDGSSSPTRPVIRHENTCRTARMRTAPSVSRHGGGHAYRRCRRNTPTYCGKYGCSHGSKYTMVTAWWSKTHYRSSFQQVRHDQYFHRLRSARSGGLQCACRQHPHTRPQPVSISRSWTAAFAAVTVSFSLLTYLGLQRLVNLHGLRHANARRYCQPVDATRRPLRRASREAQPCSQRRH